MADNSSKKSNYISRTLAAVNELTATIATLEALTLEGQTLGFVQAFGGPAGSLADGDFVGANGYMSAAQFAAIMATLGALDATVRASNAAILATLFTAHP